MPKAVNYTDEQILLALIWAMPKKLTKGQIGRVIGIKSAGQKHWSERLAKLKEKKLISNEKLEMGELFFGSPIRRYHLTYENLREIWSTYFTNKDDGKGAIDDPFQTFSWTGIWDVSRSQEFSSIVGSKFNYYFLCARNEANPFTPNERIGAISREKFWKTMDSVLSTGWKIEAYRRKPALMGELNNENRRRHSVVDSIYEAQAIAHPEDYMRFLKIFKKSFGRHV